MSRGVGTAGISYIHSESGFLTQTERKVSQWENKLKVNTEAQVWEVCLFSLPDPLPPSMGLEAGNWLGEYRAQVGGPGSAVALATAEHRSSKCGLRTSAHRKLLATNQPMMRQGQKLRVSL